jgi:hypothetical protein
MSDFDLVISYYNEDLDWINNIKDINFRYIFIYNKGNSNISNISRDFIEIKLKNIGKCDHTYLYHIINNYDNLANVTIFTTGSVLLSRKFIKFNKILSLSKSTNNSVFINEIFLNNVRDDLYDFTINHWLSSDSNNSKNELSELILSPIRPFGLWFDKYFPNIIINKVNYLGIFSVSQNHIKQHTLLYYKNLIELFPDHPNSEVGHYFERSWIAIFHPIPDNCIYDNCIYEEDNIIYNPHKIYINYFMYLVISLILIIIILKKYNLF